MVTGEAFLSGRVRSLSASRPRRSWSLTGKRWYSNSPLSTMTSTEAANSISVASADELTEAGADGITSVNVEDGFRWLLCGGDFSAGPAPLG